MEETNFNKAKAFLKAFLTEMRKGEHDQLASSLAYYGGPSDGAIIATIEEAIQELLKDVEIVKKRWELDICYLCNETIENEEPRYKLTMIFPIGDDATPRVAHVKCYREAGKK